MNSWIVTRNLSALADIASQLGGVTGARIMSHVRAAQDAYDQERKLSRDVFDDMLLLNKAALDQLETQTAALEAGVRQVEVMNERIDQMNGLVEAAIDRVVDRKARRPPYLSPNSIAS